MSASDVSDELQQPLRLVVEVMRSSLLREHGEDVRTEA
jgi:hypothetical protein